MQKTAVFWIRDGVLVDRMPVNALAFAVACTVYANPNKISQTNLTALVNFAFATSGISCADKIRQLNRENVSFVPDVEAAANYYTELASKAASYCSYFDGACELVKQLHGAGILNFITSAVEQSVLDLWVESAQAQSLIPYLTAALGKRSGGFDKGRAHFAHVRDNYGIERIFYVADAVAEISTGAQLAEEFNILPVGFANVITGEKIRRAHSLVIGAHDALSNLSKSNAHCSVQDLELDEKGLVLPDQNTLQSILKDAQATYVATGNANQIMADLATYLQMSGALPPKEVSVG